MTGSLPIVWLLCILLHPAAGLRPEVPPPAPPGEDTSRIAPASLFRSYVERGLFDRAREMMTDAPRRWWGERKGEGRPWKVGPGEEGPWAGWDTHFGSRSEVLRWEETGGSASVFLRETNDYFRLLERGWVTNEVTYYFDDAGKIDGLSIRAVGERPQGKTEEFLAWANAEEHTEIEALMPAGEIDPSGDHPQRFRRLLERWRAATGQDPRPMLTNDPAPRVLLLGTFHFQDAGRDAYKPEFTFDVLSAARQAELDSLLSALEAWRPTRIAIEVKPGRQPWLDSLYAVYPGGGMDTLRKEMYQVGFRLARRLGLPGVEAVDAPARFLDSAMTDEEWERRSNALAPGALSATDWDARFTALYRMEDSLKSVRPLSETLLRINSPERLRAGHGHYLVGDILNGKPGEYFGADGFVSAWYNRNIRIYSNILRLVRTPEERILVIFGAGHVPILRELMESSPAVKLVDLPDVIGTAGAAKK